MKTTLFLLVAVLLFACRQNNTRDQYNLFISGAIENQTTDFVLLCGTREIKEGVTGSNYVDEHGQYTVAFAKVDGKGHFALSARIDEPGFYYLRHEKWWDAPRLFLSPGDSLSITFDAEDIDKSIRYEGKSAGVSSYLLQKDSIKNTFLSGKELYSLKKDTFIKTTDSLTYLLIDYFNKFLETAGDIPQKFIAFEKANIHYSWFIQRANYPEYYKYYTSDTAVDLGDDYDAYLNEFNLSDTTLLELSTYRDALEEYLLVKVRGLVKQDSAFKKSAFPDLAAKMKLIPELFTSPAIANYLLYETLREQIQRYGAILSGSFVDDFKKLCTNGDYLSNIARKIERLSVLGEGRPVPGFAYNDISGKRVSLADFSEKYIYLDLWATWCGPCRSELPHLEKLQKEYKDKNIVFISISIDEDKEAWEKMVREESLGGIQLLADGGWKAQIIKEYKIRGIPHFFLIDREGKMILSDAPRPSGKIREILEKLEGII